MSNQTLDNTDLNLYVTHVEADGPLLKVWAQTNKEEMAGIERLMHALTAQFDKGLGSPVPQSQAIWPNIICCALFDRAYYRAKIRSLDQSGAYIVQFIDYGNTEIVQVSDIRILNGIQEAAPLQRVPPLATDFVVADVLPRDCVWEPAVVDAIRKNLQYNEYPGKIVNIVGRFRLIRFLLGDRDFVEILLEQNWAIPGRPEEIIRATNAVYQSRLQQPQVQVPKPGLRIPMQIHHLAPENVQKKYVTINSVVPLRVPRMQAAPENWRAAQASVQVQKAQVQQNDEAGVFRSRILEIGSKHEVTVSYVEDGPLMFSVHLDSTSEELRNLMCHINQSHAPKPLTEPPVIGSVCLGRYTADKTLLRAVVMQVREHDCKVHYVDFGHVEILPYKDIYQLPRQYINPRVLSIRLTMSNVNELRINDEMKEYFARYVAGKKFLLHVRPSEGSPLIQYGDLYDNGRNVKDVLKALFGDATPTWAPARKLSVNSREIAQVVYAELPIIFVQLDSEAPAMETLIEHIQKHAPAAPRLTSGQLTKGLQCLALSSDDSQWYRAEIVNVSDDAVRVYYVDYGNEETIPSASLRAVRDNTLTKLRAQAIRCVVNEYDMEIKTKELKESLEAEISQKPVAMIVTRVSPTDPMVDLYDANVDPLVNIMQRLKRASIANGNIDTRSDIYNEKIINSTQFNNNRSEEQITNKWNHTTRPESQRISTLNNSTERGKSNNWRNEENDTRRHDNNRYNNRDKEWSQNSVQQNNDRFAQNGGTYDRSTRESGRNERYDRSADFNANNRGGRGSSGNPRYSSNNSRTCNGSGEKNWSDKDSDSSSRGSGRSGRRGNSGSRSNGGRGRRGGNRTPNSRDMEGDNDRGSFKNSRSNGVSARIRDNGRRDVNDRNETKQFDTWTNESVPEAKKISIPPPNIVVGAIKNCEIVFMNNPGDFHVQLSPDNLELDPVMTNIEAIYENGGKIMDKSLMKEGVDCIAQYSEDMRWYRASVRSVEPTGATVYFVDYGNIEKVDFEKIKEIDADSAKLSAQAVACKLLAIDKATWNIDDIEKFTQLTSNNRLEAEFVANDNNVYEVLLRETIDANPSPKYINEEFSGGADLTQMRNNANVKGRNGLGKIVPTTDYASINDKWLVEDIPPGTKGNILITWFTNPDSFYCQTLTRKDEFRAMMNDIQQVYASRQPINEPLQVGSAVMAVFSEDGALYRAEVLELNKARGNIVRYIDFGNTAMVEQRNTYRVEKKFMKIPKQAVLCSLKNIVPANGTSWARSNKQEIEKCFDSDDFECTFHEKKGGTYIVSLNNKDVDVAGLLVEKSLASFAVSAHVSPQKNEITPTEEPEAEELPRFDISLLAGQILRVKVSNVAGASKFHIQLPSATATEKVIDAYMTKNNLEVMPRLSCREVCLGAGCLVNTDEGWRRAVVVNCSRTTGFDVRLIDTGANDEIPLDCMLALPGPLSVMQNQAIECCLKNAKSNIVLDEKLRDRIENTNVIVAIEEVDNSRLIVKLYDTNGKIIKMSDDEEDERICPVCPMPIFYSTQKVVVSHVEDSSSVWLKRNLDLDTEAELLSRLYDRYSASEQSDERPPTTPDALCAAKSANEIWYRAKIVRATETGALVRYIDYGNSEEMPLESLRALAPDFHAQPQLAIEVALTVTVGGTRDQQREILAGHLLDNEFVATVYNVHKKWVAELTNAEGKMSEKLSALEAVEISKSHRVRGEAVPEMSVGERYKVACYNADSPAAFWLQRLEEIPALEELQERLQIEAANCPTLEGIPEENTLCLAVYSGDDFWYRAEVIIADPEITSVRFIDFGNTDIVYTNQGKSKRITDGLKAIKRYATKCRLDVIPYGAEDWTCAANEWFETVVTSGKDMEALVIADSAPRRVELFVEGKSLVEELVNLNFASKIDTEDDLIEEIIEREVDPRAAYVSHVISPSEFWIQQEKYVGDLEILADRFIVADMFPRPKEMKEGLLCVAKFPEDDSWYRARVISHSDTRTEVIYIDYGNSAISTEIREIPEDVAAQPAFSKKCSLALPEGIAQWSEEACVEFVKMSADGATIFQLDVIEDRDDTSIVRLTRDGADIVEILAELCAHRVPVIEERLSPLGEENSPNVFVSHANSPSDFSIQAESSINELEIMVEHLLAAESFLPLEKIDEGLVCAAKFPEDDQWYRAKILSHGDAGTEVHYIDYGNSAITTELRVLPEDIVEKPALSTHCSLLVPDDVESWSKEACEKFFELVNEGITMFHYEILEEKEQSIIRLSLDGEDVAEMLRPLCAKKRNVDSASVEETERPNAEKSEVAEEIAVEESTETVVSHRETSSEECASSNDTSGVEVVTGSDMSTFSTSSKSLTSMETSNTQIPDLHHRKDMISSSTPTVQEATEISTSAAKVMQRIEEVSGNEDVTEPVENGLGTAHEVTDGSDKQESQEKSAKTPMAEKILPGSVSRGLSEEEIILGQIERRNSIPVEEKIVPGSINKGSDLTVDEANARPSTSPAVLDETDVNISRTEDPSVARKLSFDDKILPGCLSADNSPSIELKCPTTPKTPHSEKIVAGVVSLQEKLEELEIDEVISVVADDNIPK